MQRNYESLDDAGRRLAGFGTKVLTELTGGALRTFYRSDLSRLLFEKVAGRVESIYGDEIVALDEQPDCVGVQFKHAGERRFDLVIGADGLHSVVRELPSDHNLSSRNISAMPSRHSRPAATARATKTSI